LFRYYDKAELYIGGIGVARGYLNRPDLTAERFIPDPYSAELGSRLYRTGDLARYQPNGTIEFLGRIDQQIKIRGYRVEIGEIEAVLHSHPAIHQSAIRAYERAPGDTALFAYIVLEPPAVLEPILLNELLQHLRAFLPEYMVPSAFAQMDALPVSTNGKLDRHALPDPAAVNYRQSQQTYLAPQTHLERQIATIWQETLQVSQVGLHDNFFDLGGHSLLAITVQQQLHEVLEREIELTELFRHTTVHALARALSTHPDSIQSAEPAATSTAAARRSTQSKQMQKQLLMRKESRTRN